MTRHSYKQIATDFSLWGQYYDPSATMSEEQYDALDLDQAIALIEQSFGPESLTAEDQSEITAAAKVTAAMFAQEFPGEALDPAKTDWDGTAWDDDQRDLSCRPVIEDNTALYTEAWELYQSTLVAETKRLAEEAA
jgi:hypothetical protein